MSAPPVLVVPGWTSSGPRHWQTLWERADPGRFRRVEQRDWDNPLREEWVRTLDGAVAACAAPPLLVAHSLGCIAVAHWAAAFARPVAGALLVAPADVEAAHAPEPVRDFAPIPLGALPFPSILAASSDDPWLRLDRAEHMASCWGSNFIRIEAAGHLNTDAGFGPWPQGEELLRRLCFSAAPDDARV
ncbi:MAG TPA: alpha/beta hydrolase [Longimicrobium sp.]|nr:alpha/beta hydrolase [Longimicrobium sp.]